MLMHNTHTHTHSHQALVGQFVSEQVSAAEY